MSSGPSVVANNNNMGDNKKLVVQNNPTVEPELTGDETGQSATTGKSSDRNNEALASEEKQFDISDVPTHSQFIAHLCDKLYESNSLLLPPPINPLQFGRKYFNIGLMWCFTFIYFLVPKVYPVQQAFLAGLDAGKFYQMEAQMSPPHITTRSKLDMGSRSETFVQTESVKGVSSAAADSENVQHAEICSTSVQTEDAPSSPGIALRYVI